AALGRFVDVGRAQRVGLDAGLIDQRDAARGTGSKDEFGPANHGSDFQGMSRFRDSPPLAACRKAIDVRVKPAHEGRYLKRYVMRGAPNCRGKLPEGARFDNRTTPPWRRACPLDRP